MPSNSADVNLFWSYVHTGNTMHMLCSEYPFFQDLCSNNIHLNTLKSPSFSSTLQKKLASNFFKHHFPGCKTPSFFTFDKKLDPLNSLTAKNQVHHVADRWDFWRLSKNGVFFWEIPDVSLKPGLNTNSKLVKIFIVWCKLQSMFFFFRVMNSWSIFLNLWCRCDQLYFFWVGGAPDFIVFFQPTKTYQSTNPLVYPCLPRCKEVLLGSNSVPFHWKQTNQPTCSLIVLARSYVFVDSVIPVCVQGLVVHTTYMFHPKGVGLCSITILLWLWVLLLLCMYICYGTNIIISYNSNRWYVLSSVYL